MDAVRAVSDKLMQKHRVLPLMKRGKRLFLAVADPTNLHALDEIRFQTSMSIEFVVVEDDKLQMAVGKAMDQAEAAMPSLTDDDFDLENLEVTGGDERSQCGCAGRDDVEDAPIVRFVNKILLDAIKKGASDIHFEPYEKSFRIRTRLDGVLKEVALPPVQLAIKIVARLKVMARLDIAERRCRRTAASKCACRRTAPSIFASVPARRCSARRWSPVFSIPRAPCWASMHWAMSRLQRELYLKYLAKPQGMILVTGPTGSGKTVSLYTGLNILNTEDCNISTAEDPAEINLPGINQVNVNNKVGLTFASALRAFLRQDPDVIMVGEIRDLETAEIAIKAAQTGHLVLSTLHTNDAPQTLTRLVDMGVKPYAIATSVSLIIAQRLARKLCTTASSPSTSLPKPLKKGRLRGFRATSRPASECTRRSAAANAPTATRAAWGSTRSCRSRKPSAASSCKAVAPWTSTIRRPRTAFGICAAPDCKK
jgi:type IV pilus assembly protein PilB